MAHFNMKNGAFIALLLMQSCQCEILNDSQSKPLSLDLFQAKRSLQTCTLPSGSNPPLSAGSICTLDSDCSSQRCVFERDYIDNHPHGYDPPHGGFKLTLCEGDCDDDNECANGLSCKHDTGGNVPGCGLNNSYGSVFSGYSSADICYAPVFEE